MLGIAPCFQGKFDFFLVIRLNYFFFAHISLLSGKYIAFFLPAGKIQQRKHISPIKQGSL
jgi:hypothetical protein